jgi:hypothetical protein
MTVATSLRKSKTVLIRKGEEMKKIDKLKFEKITIYIFENDINNVD